MKKLRATELPGGKFLRVIFKDDDLVVTLVMGDGKDPMALHNQTTFPARVEEYRMKCGSSVALGLGFGNPAKAYDDCAIWMEGPWQPDSVMDAMLAGDRPKAAFHQKLPGRNDPCICGSAVRSRKCCLDRIKMPPLGAF